MGRDEIVSRLRENETRMRTFGVSGLFVFGSRARDNASADSDLDVFVDPSEDAFYNLDNFMGPYLLLQDLFPGLDIGYTTRSGLLAGVREQAEARLSGSFDAWKQTASRSPHPCS